jgi:RHS repeat-associated protein
MQLTLDGTANWLVRQGAGGFTPALDDFDRYRKIDDADVNYDPSGNLVSVSSADYHYEWDALDRPRSATRGQVAHTFQYDALGRRSSETDGNDTTFYVWDDLALIAIGRKSAPDDAQLRVRLGAGISVALAAKLGAGPISFLHASSDGSSYAATGPDGELLEAYEYSGFGETQVLGRDLAPRPSSALGNRYLFQGQLYDPEFGLYWLQNRAYKPDWGRFLSPDPVGIDGGPNRYVFVGGRPLTFRDDLGLTGQPAARRPTEAQALFEVNQLLAGYEREHPLWSYGDRPWRRQSLELADVSADPERNIVLRMLTTVTWVGTAPLTIAEKIAAVTAETAVHALQHADRDKFVVDALNKRGFGPEQGYWPATRLFPDDPHSPIVEGTASLHQALLESALTVATIPTAALAPEGALLAQTGSKVVPLMTSFEKGEVGVQLTASAAIESGATLIGREISFENLVSRAEGLPPGVEGRIDLVAKLPGLPEDYLIGLESKAGPNARFTPGQAVNIQWMGGDFVPVRVFGDNAVRAGLTPGKIYMMNMEVHRWIFH